MYKETAETDCDFSQKSEMKKHILFSLERKFIWFIWFI